MKQRLIKLFLILITGISPGIINSQNIVIEEINGSETEEPLNTVQNLTFPSGDLHVLFFSGTMNSFALSEIQKIYFTGVVSTEDLYPEEDNLLLVHPNPAGNSITVEGIPNDANVLTIWNAFGQLITEKKTNNEKMTININNLPAGLYFIKINASTVKFIKQ